MRRVEVYLPGSYKEALTVTTIDGDIDMASAALQLSELRIDTTAGRVSLGNAAASSIYLSTTRGALDLGTVEADNISLAPTSGDVTCGALSGHVEYTTTSGNVSIKSAITSETISLALPDELSFVFEAVTKNGNVEVTQ